MKIFFDVDYTIQADDGTLRPGVREVFSSLIEQGHLIYIWSGIGIRWTDIRRHNLQDLVQDVFLKPIFKYKEETSRLPVYPDFIVDDHPEIVKELGGFQVEPYWTKDDSDTEMQRVYIAIQNHLKDKRN